MYSEEYEKYNIALNVSRVVDNLITLVQAAFNIVRRNA